MPVPTRASGSIGAPDRAPLADLDALVGADLEGRAGTMLAGREVGEAAAVGQAGAHPGAQAERGCSRLRDVQVGHIQAEVGPGFPNRLERSSRCAGSLAELTG